MGMCEGLVVGSGGKGRGTGRGGYILMNLEVYVFIMRYLLNYYETYKNYYGM